MKRQIILSWAAISLLLPSSADVIWAEDFEAETIGTLTATNNNIGKVQPCNTLTSEVVAAPPEFTSASGNVLLLSTGANNFSAIRPSSTLNPIVLPAIADGKTWALSFDIYIPADLAEEVGGMANFRWKDGGANNVNGPSDLSGQTLTAGVHHIEYTGTFPIDINNGPFLPTNVRPFINFDLGGTAGTNYVYFDNLNFEVEVSDDDPNLAAGGTNFGELDLDTGTYSRPVAISNTGSAQTLNITNATLSGADVAKYAITNTTFPLNIAPGETGNIEVTFDSATDLGEFIANLEISSNDQSDPTSSIELRASTSEPFVGRELIVNGDFETGDLTGWRVDNRLSFVNTPTQSGTGASLYTFVAAQQWGNARLETTPPNGLEFDPVSLAITPEMIGKEFKYSAWFYRPSTNGMADTDEIAFVMRWNKITTAGTSNFTLANTLGSEMPFDTWIRVTGSGIIPELDNEGNAVTFVETVWSFRDHGVDNPGGLLIYMDEVSLKVDAPLTPPVVVDPEITIINRSSIDGIATFTWNSTPGQSFDIEYSNDLESWIEIEDEFPASTNLETSTYTDNSSASADRRFYRVILRAAP